VKLAKCLYPEPGDEGGDEGLEIEVKIIPSDPQVQYSPSDAWSSTGGACTNGTKLTTQLRAEILFLFEGVENPPSLVPNSKLRNGGLLSY
jgi:hypothetical protein